MTTRVNNFPIQNVGASPVTITFDGGVCDSAFVKVTKESASFGATSVTYGGIAMTKLASIVDFNGCPHEIWGLQNAPQGSVSIVITDGGGGLAIIASVESYSGVSTSATFPNVTGSAEHHINSGSNMLIQVDVTTTINDCILVGLGGYRGSGITFMSAGSDTILISRNPPTGGLDLSLESNPLDVGVAGTYHLIGTTGGGDVNIAISMVVVALAPGPAATPSFIPQIIVI